MPAHTENVDFSQSYNYNLLALKKKQGSVNSHETVLGIFTFVLFLSAAMNTAALSDDYDTFVVQHLLNLPQSGLEITKWNSWYRANDTVTFGDAFASAMFDTSPQVREAGFQYDLGLKNTSSKNIIAYQLNFIAFNPWGEYLDTVGIFMGAIMKPEKEIFRKNKARFNGENQFFEFFIWIDKVRWEDGKTYLADVSMVKVAIDDCYGIDFPLDLLRAGNVIEVNQRKRFKEKQYVDVWAQ